jgi:uncharacterized RDD family membrane protein YckC
MDSEEPTEDSPSEESSLPLAGFLDRFVAFYLDTLIFSAGFYAVLLILAAGGANVGPFAFPLGLLAFASMLAYHGFFAAGGRQTLGKKLMGVRVVTLEGGDLDLKTSFKRAASYVPGTFLLYLGFLWALGPKRAAWHDRLAGTRVIDVREKGPLAQALTAGAALAIAGLFALAWAWVFLGAPRFARMQMVAGARTGLKALSVLEDKIKADTGAYTEDAAALAQAYGNPEEFTQLTSKLFKPGSLQITATPEGYRLQAVALDDQETPVSVDGPSK